MNGLASLPAILGVPATITSGFGLAALCITLAWLVARTWLLERRRMVSDAIRAKNKDALATLIGVKPIELAGLSGEQSYLYALQKLKMEFRTRIFLYSLIAIIIALVLLLVLVPDFRKSAKVDAPASATVGKDASMDSLKQKAFETFSGDWFLDDACDYAMRFSVEDGTIVIRSPEPDARIVSSFNIIGAYRDGITGDNNGVAVHLWTQGASMIYDNGGMTQRFQRCPSGH